jgi:hypothetical protein
MILPAPHRYFSMVQERFAIPEAGSVALLP